MKKILIGLMVLMVIFALSIGCNNTDKDTADSKQAAETVKAMNEAQRQVGMPNVINFQQRKLMKMVYELCDKEDLICYAYIKSDYQGKLMFIGKCIGFGIPFSAQYTNPMKIIDPDHIPGQNYINGEGTPAIIPQADPNGLFMPTSSSATWLMMIDPKTNEPRPVYIEPEIVVSAFPLH